MSKKKGQKKMKSFASSMSSSSSSSNHQTQVPSASNLLSSFRSNLAAMDSTSVSFGNSVTSGGVNSSDRPFIPHQGALCRLVQEDTSDALLLSATTTPTTSSTSTANANNKSNNTHAASAAAAMMMTTTPIVLYGIEIGLPDSTTHELQFSTQDFDFCQKLFAILDTESRGAVDRATVQEFVTLRCPVFCRRDEDVRRAAKAEAAANNNNNITAHFNGTTSPTFDEVWKSVVESSPTLLQMEDYNNLMDHHDDVELGVEAWMVFCRFIALAQYLEAKRRFSARHLQQTMRHRNSPRGSELVVVDVPPPEPPAPLSSTQLAAYERKSRTPLPLPELDLDHSLVAAHDSARRRGGATRSCPAGTVKISLFGSSSHHHHHHGSSTHHHSTPAPVSSNVEFKITYTKHCSEDDGPNARIHNNSDAPVVVRRSMDDMKWLNDTFTSHNVLGGTLCGRILPPFPGSNGKILAAQFQMADDTLLNSSIKNTTGGAIAAAAAGVEIIKDVAKSIWKTTKNAPPGSSNNGSGTSTNPSSQHHHTKKTSNTHASKPKSKATPAWCLALPQSYYNPNSPAGKARQVERYLNYLLEHPALSTSFPLNTILKASQSGLEAAKQSLEECLRLSKEVKEQTPQLVDGKTILPFWGLSGQPSSLSWVRTAAQAAMALKVHGILETTGMQSASARLQHASLPTFDHPAGRNSMDWGDEEQADDHANSASGESAAAEPSDNLTNSFEQGVVTVQSELKAELFSPHDDDGYDLLPLPVPAPERRILSAGSRMHHQGDSSSVSSGQGGSVDSREARFHYGTQSLRRRLPIDDDDDSRSAFLGDISVDEHIDKLREVIGSVDNTLSRCLASGGGIGRARRERLALHLDIVQGFDSWKGLRGKFIGQRALLKGVSGIEQSNEVYEESDLALIDDVSWQTALADSAVHAAEDVRSAVRAARTAESAKAAASAAAFTAQSVCEAGSFPSIDEARAAQTRASIAQSHAFHAAVVEHEAKAVKRRATLALAHDVKCWNVHRKREMLKACIAHAKSQHEATRRAVDAWSCLRDGFIGSSIVPPAQTRKVPPLPPQNAFGHMSSRDTNKTTRKTSMSSSMRSSSAQSTTSSGPIDFLSAGAFSDLLDMSAPCATASSHSNMPVGSSSEGTGFSCINHSEVTEEEATATIYQDLGTGNGKPVIVAVDHNILSSSPPSQPLQMASSVSNNNIDRCDSKTDSDNEVLPFAEHVFPLVPAAPVEEVDMMMVSHHEEPTNFATATASEERKPMGRSSSEENEIMSASMQSLVDGLMSWGGQFEFESEDVLALPTGMAANIAFEAENEDAF